jgi:hypothetical protein
MSDTASARRFGTTFFGRREDNASQEIWSARRLPQSVSLKVLSGTRKPVKWLPRHGTSWRAVTARTS